MEGTLRFVRSRVEGTERRRSRADDEDGDGEKKKKSKGGENDLTPPPTPTPTASFDDGDDNNNKNQLKYPNLLERFDAFVASLRGKRLALFRCTQMVLGR